MSAEKRVKLQDFLQNYKLEDKIGHTASAANLLSELLENIIPEDH